MLYFKYLKLLIKHIELQRKHSRTLKECIEILDREEKHLQQLFDLVKENNDLKDQIKKLENSLSYYE